MPSLPAWERSSGRCSETVGGDVGSVPGHAQGSLHCGRLPSAGPAVLAAVGRGLLSTFLGLRTFRRELPGPSAPRHARLWGELGVPRAAPGPMGARCGPSEPSLTPNIPVPPQLGARALLVPQCSRFALGLGKSEPALPNSQDSGLALAQLGWGFLLLLGCKTKCWAGSTDVQPDHSSEAVNTAMGALAFICKANVSWFGDPSLTPPALQIPFGI